PNPYNTYSIIEGDNTLNPEEITQQITRNRKIKELCLYINKLSNIKKYESLKDIKDTYKRGVGAFKEAFSELIDTQTNDKGTQIDYKENIFTELLYNLEYNNDILKSSFSYNLFKILENKGFNVERNLYKSLTLEKGELNNIKEQMKGNKEEIISDYINNNLDNTHKAKIKLDRILKDLDIPHNEDLKNHIEILKDDKAISQHINFRLMTTKTEILKLLNEEDLNNDYLEIIYKDKKPKILILREIFNDYFKNDINLFKYEYSHDAPFLNDDIILKDYHFEYIKSILRTKKDKPNTKGDLLILLNNVIKSLLGREIIKSKEIKINKDDKRISVYNYSFNEDILNKHIELYKLSLNNDNKYKYINLIDDIKEIYFNNIEISNEDNENFYKGLENKKYEIENNKEKDKKEHIKLNESFKKINNKLIKNKEKAQIDKAKAKKARAKTEAEKLN
ncbi:MAG: hypothetical protein ACR2IJ_09800, partial [Fluviibacter sp.]